MRNPRSFGELKSRGWSCGTLGDTVTITRQVMKRGVKRCISTIYRIVTGKR